MGGWTASAVAASVTLFLVAGVCEVGGGWLVWQACREGKPWWWALIGSCVLILYGFVPCAQPIADFGRLYAAYGGFFVALSVAWARVFDGFKPDVGDFIGCAIALIGVGVILFYPRLGGGVEPGASAVFPKLANGA